MEGRLSIMVCRILLQALLFDHSVGDTFGGHVLLTPNKTIPKLTNRKILSQSSKKGLQDVFSALNIKPIFDTVSHRNRSTSYPITNQRSAFWPFDPNLALLGVASLGSISLLSLPFLVPNFQQRITQTMNSRQNFQGAISNAMVGASETFMTWVERYVDELPDLPKMNAQECLKRSVCEAYNKPRKYGILGFLLQLLFPPYTETNEREKAVSPYQLAARYGRQSHANCSLQYDGCIVNFLDVFQALGNLILLR